MIHFYRAHFTGEPRAACTGCTRVWVYWESPEELEHRCHDTYTIERWPEVTHCGQCGQPLDIGDTVYTDDPEVITYTACSRACAEQIAPN